MNGVCKEYIVTVEPAYVGPFNVSCHQMRIKVAWLHSFQQHTFSVVAVNHPLPTGKARPNTSPPLRIHVASFTSAPAPPRNGTAIVLSDRSVILSWIPPKSTKGNCTQYKVTAEPKLGHPVTVSCGVTEAIVTGLIPMQAYWFSVVIVTQTADNSNSVAVSPPLYVFALLWSSAPSVPRGGRATVSSGNSVNLNWMEPEHMNGQCDHYNISMEPAIGPSIIVNCEEKQVRVSNLQPFSDYIFSVVVFNKPSPPNASRLTTSPALTIRAKTWSSTASVPTNVTAIALSSDSVKVSWREPEFVNGECEHYRISVEPAHSLSIEANCMEWDAIISGLKPFQNYTFSVVAVNQRHHSNGKQSLESPAGIVHAKTWSYAPTKPKRGNVNARSHDFVELSWVEPEYMNGNFMHYIVTWGTQPTKSNITTEKSLIIRGLSQETLYVFSVMAVSERYPGNQSHPQTSLPLYFTIKTPKKALLVNQHWNRRNAPQPPRNIKTFPGIDSVNLTWMSPNYYGGDRIYYEVMSNLISGENVFIDYNDTNARITGLQPFTSYTFTVSAFYTSSTYQLVSRSAIVAATTLPDLPLQPKEGNVTALAVDSVQLTWSAPEYMNGNCKEYVIRTMPPHVPPFTVTCDKLWATVSGGH